MSDLAISSIRSHSRHSVTDVRAAEHAMDAHEDSLLMAVICFELFLQPQDLLVALVQAPCEPCHDVPLLHQQALVAVHLHSPCITEVAFQSCSVLHQQAHVAVGLQPPCITEAALSSLPAPSAAAAAAADMQISVFTPACCHRSCDRQPGKPVVWSPPAHEGQGPLPARPEAVHRWMPAAAAHLGLVLLSVQPLPLQLLEPDLVLPAHPPLLPRQQRPERAQRVSPTARSVHSAGCPGGAAASGDLRRASAPKTCSVQTPWCGGGAAGFGGLDECQPHGMQGA